MSWPWSELGLDGPSSLEEIRRAYAARTRQTHPEEDPEGFQRLHAAYQLAKKLVRKTNAAQKNVFAEENAENPFAFSQDMREEKKHWDDAWLQEDQAPDISNGVLRENAAAKHWDYDRIFAEAAQERETKHRRELQARSGLTDENDSWEQALPALREMETIQQEGMPLERLYRFLQSPVFARVRENTTFILALEDWICAAAPIPITAQSMLLEHLGLQSGHIPPMYKKVHALLGGSDAATYRRGKQKTIKTRKKQVLHVVAVCMLVCSLTLIFMMQLFPATQKNKQEARVMQWLSEDLGMTIEVYENSVPVGGKDELRLRAKEMPAFVFSAAYQGDRDVEKGQCGYISNFSSAAFDWRLRQLALDSAYRLRERNGWDWSMGKAASPPVYYLEFPLVEAEEAVQKLDVMYQDLQDEPWYQDSPPQYKLQFSRAGVSYYTLDAPTDIFDAPAVAEYCMKSAPEAICAFLLETTGLDEADFSSSKYGVFQVESGLSLDDPDFYFVFVAIDTESKEKLRMYAYSEKQNELLSFPVEEYVKGRTFYELKQACSRFYSSKRTGMRFPKLFRWSQS